MLKRIITLSIVLSVCVGCDQFTKQQASRYLSKNPPISFGADIFRLQYAENSGAMLSMGSRLSPRARFYIFTVMVGGLLTLMFAYAVFNPMTHRMLLAMAMIMGGGFSNFIDRALNDGRVVDFMNLGIGALRTGIFNVADIFITCGAVMMLWIVFTNQGDRIDGVKR